MGTSDKIALSGLILSGVTFVVTIVTVVYVIRSFGLQKRQLNEQTFLAMLSNFRSNAEKVIYFDGKDNFESYEAFEEMLKAIDADYKGIQKQQEEARSIASSTPKGFAFLSRMNMSSHTVHAYLFSLDILIQFLDSHDLPKNDKEFYSEMIKSSLARSEIVFLKRLPEVGAAGSNEFESSGIVIRLAPFTASIPEWSTVNPWPDKLTQ